MRPVWYLRGPFYQYAEDVGRLAEANGLRIIDARYTESREHSAESVPDVTLRPAYGGPPLQISLPEPTETVEVREVKRRGRKKD